MSGKRKREEDDFDFTPPSGKTQREEVKRSGRARKKPARFLDESIEEDIDKIETPSPEEDDESTTNKPIKMPTIKSPQMQSKLLMQTLQNDQKPMAILSQQTVPPVQIQIPAASLLHTVSAQQGLRVISPTAPHIISPTGQQPKIETPMSPQVMQQVVQHMIPQNIVQMPTSPAATTDYTDAGKRGRVRKKSAKVLEMEEFEEAEKSKPKKGTPGKQQGSTVVSPIQQSPPSKQFPPTGVTIVKNEQGQNVVLSVAGGIPNIVKTEPALGSSKKSKSKGKSKDQIINDGTQISDNVLVKEEPSDLSSAPMMSSDVLVQQQGISTSSKKQKQIKTEPTLSKKASIVNQESPPSPTKKGKSVIKMLLNTPTQFSTPTVSTTAISSDKQKELDKSMEIKSEPKVVTGDKQVKKIVLSPSDLDDSHSFDEEEDDEESDEDFDDEDDDIDDDDDMEWQFESQDGTLLGQDEVIRRVKVSADISPGDGKKGKKKASKKKLTHEDDDFDEDDFGDDDDDDDEGNLVIADEIAKKKKTTKKAPSKKKGDASKSAGKIRKSEVNMDKEKKRKRLTAYTMWCNSMRSKVLAESPGIDFAQLSKRLGEIWQGLPSRDKMSWKRKAKREVRKLAGKGLLIRTGKLAPPAPTPTASTVVPQKQSQLPKTVPPIHHTPITHHKTAVTMQKLEEHSVQLRGSGIEAIDVAAYLKLVGESLSIIGMRLQEHRGLIAVQGSLSVLLDSLLCALGPLMCLTTQIPELHGCPAETHSRTLDNLAYFMPGL